MSDSKPSASRICRRFYQQDRLCEEAWNIGKQGKDWRREQYRAMDLGWDVHQAIFSAVKGCVPDLDSPEMVNAIQSFRKWWDALGIPAGTEIHVAEEHDHPSGYRALVDLWWIVGSTLVTVDVSTEEVVDLSVSLPLIAAQNRVIYGPGESSITNRVAYFVRLDAKSGGPPSVWRLTDENMTEAFSTFFKFLAAHEGMHRMSFVGLATREM